MQMLGVMTISPAHHNNIGRKKPVFLISSLCNMNNNLTNWRIAYNNNPHSCILQDSSSFSEQVKAHRCVMKFHTCLNVDNHRLYTSQLDKVKRWGTPNGWPLCFTIMFDMRPPSEFFFWHLIVNSSQLRNNNNKMKK